MLCDFDTSKLAPWVRRVHGAMPNNWSGRIAMRAVIAQAREARGER